MEQPIYAHMIRSFSYVGAADVVLELCQQCVAAGQDLGLDLAKEVLVRLAKDAEWSTAYQLLKVGECVCVCACVVGAWSLSIEPLNPVATFAQFYSGTYI